MHFKQNRIDEALTYTSKSAQEPYFVLGKLLKEKDENASRLFLLCTIDKRARMAFGFKISPWLADRTPQAETAVSY